jgi:hypothetical protein
VSARHIPEALHIGNIFWPLLAFPRQFAAQPELATPADGAHRAHVSHETLPFCRYRRSHERVITAPGGKAKDRKHSPAVPLPTRGRVPVCSWSQFGNLISCMMLL